MHRGRRRRGGAGSGARHPAAPAHAAAPQGAVPGRRRAARRPRPGAGRGRAVDAVAVNVHHGGAQSTPTWPPSPPCRSRRTSRSAPRVPSGTSAGGSTAAARVVVNADAWCPGRWPRSSTGWDGERVRLLLAGDDELRPTSRLAGALLPWSAVGGWRPSRRVSTRRRGGRRARSRAPRGRAATTAPSSTAAPRAQYLAANLAASGGRERGASPARWSRARSTGASCGATQVDAGEALSLRIRAESASPCWCADAASAVRAER